MTINQTPPLIFSINNTTKDSSYPVAIRLESKPEKRYKHTARNIFTGAGLAFLLALPVSIGLSDIITNVGSNNMLPDSNNQNTSGIESDNKGASDSNNTNSSDRKLDRDVLNKALIAGGTTLGGMTLGGAVLGPIIYGQDENKSK